MVQVERAKTYAAYAPKVAPDAIEFYVTTPFDKLSATPGNGTMVALAATTKQAVEQFHRIGLKNGGTDEGPPGPREKGSSICYAYILDFDGNKVCAFYDDQKKKGSLMDDYPLLDPARILPTYVGDNQVSPFHYCYANKKTIFRLAAGRFYAHHNGEDVTSSYWALRKHAALFDVPERPVEIVGIDAVSFVEHIVARKIADMKIGRGRYVILCTHQGGIFMDGILFRLAKNKFWLVHPDADLDTWLLANKNGFDVTFTDPKSWVLQLQGPKSFQIMNDATNGVLDEEFGYFHFGLFKVDGQEIYVSRTGWTGELGYEIYTLGEQTDCERLWHHVMSKGKYHGMVFSSMLAMNIRRIEAGILDSGSDFNSLMTPSEVGLERFIDLRKKDFVGRKALEITNPGNRLFGLSCDGFSPNANDLVLSDEAVVGKVTTGAFSPYLKLGIGYVRFEKPSDWADKTLTLISHRSGAVPCKIVDLPFYDQEKLLPHQINFNGKSS